MESNPEGQRRFSPNAADRDTGDAAHRRAIRSEVRTMEDATRVFIHGLDSSSRGTKGSFFRERYPTMLMEDYSGPLEARLGRLTESLAGKNNLILVGSSYGGLMAALLPAKTRPGSGG
jgi:pimeloyl-ACP methyl ester carboxylesterase